MLQRGFPCDMTTLSTGSKINFHFLLSPLDMRCLEFIPSLKPSDSWSLWTASTYCYSILLFWLSTKIPPSARVFLTSLNMWQTSNIMQSSLSSSTGFGNLDFKFAGSKLAPYSWAMVKWQDGPSKVTKTNCAPVSCSLWRQTLTIFHAHFHSNHPNERVLKLIFTLLGYKISLTQFLYNILIMLLLLWSSSLSFLDYFKQ